MVEKNYRKQIELLRFLINEGNTLKNEQIAEKLGMSIATLQKTAQNLNIVMYENETINEKAQALKLIERRLFYNRKKGMSDYIFKVFAEQDANNIRREREAAILKLLHKHPHLTYTALKNELINTFEEEHFILEESQVKRLVKSLKQEGLVVERKEKVGKQTKTYIQIEPFFSLFQEEQLIKLLHFIIYCKYNSIVPAAAYTIEQKLMRYLNIPQPPNETFYPYIYPGRALDDPIVYDIVEAITKYKAIELKYSNVKLQKKFTSDDKNEQLQTKVVRPLQLVYDAIYSRWYLLATGRKKRLQRYRIDYIKNVKLHEDAPHNKEEIAAIRAQLQNSWNVSNKPLERIIIRFYQHETNFIARRVQQQRHRGEVLETYEDGFLWAILIHGIDEMIPWIRSFGSSAEVLEPASLREKLIEQWKELEALYVDYPSL